MSSVSCTYMCQYGLGGNTDASETGGIHLTKYIPFIRISYSGQSEIMDKFCCPKHIFAYIMTPKVRRFQDTSFYPRSVH